MQKYANYMQFLIVIAYNLINGTNIIKTIKNNKRTKSK